MSPNREAQRLKTGQQMGSHSHELLRAAEQEANMIPPLQSHCSSLKLDSSSRATTVLLTRHVPHDTFILCIYVANA